jgi:hypothetical protein
MIVNSQGELVATKQVRAVRIRKKEKPVEALAWYVVMMVIFFVLVKLAA